MLGPADIEDMMLEFAEAEAVAREQDPPHGSKLPPATWSWGMGPTWTRSKHPLPMRHGSRGFFFCSSSSSNIEMAKLIE